MGKKLLNLTPIGNGWGRGLRLLEIVVQVFSLLVLVPLQLLYRGLSWLLSKVQP